MGNPLELDSVSGELVKFTDQPQAFLLDDILICILRRLDVRDVARCRCVCKKWKDLTSNPQFEESLLMPVSNLPMILSKHTIYSEPPAQTTEFCIDKWWRTETLIHKVSSSSYNGHADQQSSQNGFIFTLISHLLPYENIVRNPMTGEQVTIFLHEESLPKCVQAADILGIFLHPIGRDQYCTLWRVSVLGHSVYHTQYKMFNLGSGSDDQPTCWRNIGHLWTHWWVPDTSAVCLDGFMYWMVNHQHNYLDPYVPLIISFDMKTEDFTEMPLPSTYIHFQFKSPSNLLNADGSLSLVQVVVDEVITVKMWTLKDPKTRFWTASQYVLWQVKPLPELWQVQGHSWGRMHQSPRAVAIVNSELVIEGIVGEDGSKGLFVCNLKFGTLRELGENKYSHDARFWAHQPSIASLRNCQPVIHITQE